MLSYIQWTNCPLRSSLKRFWFTTDRIVLDEIATHFVFLFVFLVFSLNAEAEEQWSHPRTKTSPDFCACSTASEMQVAFTGRIIPLFCNSAHLFSPACWFMCDLNQSNVSLMSGISFHACISPPLHLAEQHEISVSRGADVTLWNFSPEATSGPVSLTPTVWVAVAVGGRWVVVGLAAHWARGLAHPTTDPALRRGRLQ